MNVGVRMIVDCKCEKCGHDCHCGQECLECANDVCTGCKCEHCK